MIRNREVIFGVVSVRESASGVVQNRDGASGEVSEKDEVSGGVSMSVMRLDPHPAAEMEEF